MASHPYGTVFHTPEMYDVFAISDHIHPIVVAAIENDQIVGILLVQYITNGNTIASWFTARSIITGGPLARNNDPKIVQSLSKNRIDYNSLSDRDTLVLVKGGDYSYGSFEFNETKESKKRI